VRKLLAPGLLLVLCLLLQSFPGVALAKNDTSLLWQPSCKKFKTSPLIDTTFTQAYKHHGTVYVDIDESCPAELEDQIFDEALMWTQEEFPITDSNGDVIFVCRRRDNGSWVQPPNENMLPPDGKIYVSAHFFGNEENIRPFETPINLKTPLKIENWGTKKLISIRAQMSLVPKKVIETYKVIRLLGSGKLFENDLYMEHGQERENGESYTGCYIDNPKNYCAVEYLMYSDKSSNYFDVAPDFDNHPTSENFFKQISLGKHVIHFTYTNHSGESYPLRVPFKVVDINPKIGSERIDLTWQKDSKPWDESPCGIVTNNLNVNLKRRVKISLQIGKSKNGPWTTVTSTRANFDFCFKDGSIKANSGYYRVTAANLKPSSSHYYYYKYVPPCRPDYESATLWKTYLRIDKAWVKYWNDVLSDDRKSINDAGASGDLLGVAEAQSQYDSDNIESLKAEAKVAKDEAKVSKYSCN
jgi:hypothetical protein